LLRIGINTGPAIAGVIGTKKFSYDLWGDSVNTASRMESYGVPGSIQVSERTYNQLKGEFDFEERGAVSVKGKGDMTLYFLRGRRIAGSPTS
jgi:class 3 adenylate cyclase